MKKGIAAVIFLRALSHLGMRSERGEKAVYEITAEGSAQESGVIAFAGLEMNVYQDPASNPCGDCPDQPVSIYVGNRYAGNRRGDGGSGAAGRRSLGGYRDDRPQSDPSGEDTGKCDARAGAFRAERFDADGFFFPSSGEVRTSSRALTEKKRNVRRGDEDSQNLDGKEMQVPEEAPERIAAVYGPACEALTV